MSVRNQTKYVVCFKHRKTCLLAKSENYANNLRVNDFLNQHIGCPIALLNKNEICEYSDKRFRELLHIFEKN
ncbi:hypothetical protein ES705_23183 [subsurface metagenome]